MIRYVYIECDNVEVKELSFGFFPITKNTTAKLTEDILRHLESAGQVGHKAV